MKEGVLCTPSFFASYTMAEEGRLCEETIVVLWLASVRWDWDWGFWWLLCFR